MDRELKKDNSKIILAFVLIGVGIFWALRTLGFHFEFPHFIWDNIFYPLKNIFHRISHLIFSWPMIMIIIGGILLAGKRSVGLVLVVIGGIFILPKMFFWPGLTLSFALPFVLIGIGVLMVTKKI